MNNAMKKNLLRAIILASTASAMAITYDEWRDIYFPSGDPAISSESADPDGDGRSNMLEFAIGTDPWQRDATNWPVVSLDATGHLNLQFTRRKNAAEIVFTAQGILDLRGQRWLSGPLHLTEVTAIPVNAELDLVTMRDAAAAPGASARFVRLLAAYDLDGDGLPDDWESLHGLDPSNPNDGADDADGDFLSNLAEFQSGTDPQNIYNNPPAAPPAAPSNVTVIRNADGSIEIYWQDNSNDETEFIIRDYSPGGSFTELGRVGPDKTYLLIPPVGSPTPEP